MKQLTYTEELAELAAEIQADDPTLSYADAVKQAREQMTELYRLALDYTQRSQALRGTPIRAA